MLSLADICSNLDLFITCGTTGQLGTNHILPPFPLRDVPRLPFFCFPQTPRGAGTGCRDALVLGQV